MAAVDHRACTESNRLTDKAWRGSRRAALTPAGRVPRLLGVLRFALRIRRRRIQEAERRSRARLHQLRPFAVRRDDPGLHPRLNDDPVERPRSRGVASTLCLTRPVDAAV
jgi:hypothetical protein